MNMTISKETEKYLRKKEWSMGNGQCDECEGLGPDMYTLSRRVTADPSSFGHEKDCKFAKMMVELGLDVQYVKAKSWKVLK